MSLKRTHPDLFQRAIEMENKSLERRRKVGKSFAPLLPNGPALEDLDRQAEMFTDCDFSEITTCECMI